MWVTIVKTTAIFCQHWSFVSYMASTGLSSFSLQDKNLTMLNSQEFPALCCFQSGTVEVWVTLSNPPLKRISFFSCLYFGLAVLTTHLSSQNYLGSLYTLHVTTDLWLFVKTTGEDFWNIDEAQHSRKFQQDSLYSKNCLIAPWFSWRNAS